MSLYLTVLWQLLRFHHLVHRGDFPQLYEAVRRRPPSSKSFRWSVANICRTVDIVSMLYPAHVSCLHRSAATAWILRKYGHAARLVIGVQNLPFKAHAWVEVEDTIVNDKSYVRELYAVIDRC